MTPIVRILSLSLCCLFIVLPAFAAEYESCIEAAKMFFPDPSPTERQQVSLPESNHYTYQRHTDNQVSVIWQDSTLRAIRCECDKAAFREKLENEISRFEKFEKLSGKNPNSWAYLEIIIEMINKKVVPELGIIGISFSNPTTLEDAVEITVSLKSVCGYTVGYDINAGSWSAKGARIK